MALTSLEKHYLLALCANDLFGFQHITALYTQYQSFEKIYKSNPAEWASISTGTKEKWQAQKEKLDIEKIVQLMESHQAKLLSYFDDEYPQLLREISSPPVVLYYQGNLQILQAQSLAIVGTRMISSYGQQIIDEFVPTLVSAGLTITSGFQRGVDQAAHKAALHNEGRTIAVLGTGLDVNYPTNSSSLRRKIIESGSLILSEYPFGTVGFKANFPRRNRIVSGLSLGVLVVEAAIKSGSMITPRFALDQNREVFAVPGPIFSKLSEGPNYLIQQGAKCTYSPRDILTELGIVRFEEEQVQPIFENAIQKQIYSQIERESSSIDTLSALLDYPIDILSVEVTLLEVEGIIQKNPDNTYSRRKLR